MNDFFKKKKKKLLCDTATAAIFLRATHAADDANEAQVCGDQHQMRVYHFHHALLVHHKRCITGATDHFTLR